MKSKASFKSHPIHPILIAFPIAFYIGTLLFDVLFIIYGNEYFERTALYLNIAAIVTALAAAVPGFIDYLYTVPPQSSAKDRAAKHGITNVGALLLFVAALLLRNNANASYVIIALLELAGVVLTGIAGWMGGTLVYRNQIGIDMRYADAGRWNEERISAKGNKVKVADTAELSLNQMKLVHLNNLRIIIAKSDDGYVAFEDRCTHRGGSLAGGSMMCNTVQCPWHGSQFNVHTGDVKAGPAKKRIFTYKVSTEGNNIFIEL